MQFFCNNVAMLVAPFVCCEQFIKATLRGGDEMQMLLLWATKIQLKLKLRQLFAPPLTKPTSFMCRMCDECVYVNVTDILSNCHHYNIVFAEICGSQVNS